MQNSPLGHPPRGEKLTQPTTNQGKREAMANLSRSDVIHKADLDQLIELLGRLGDASVAARATAALAVHRFIEARGLTWETLLSPALLVVTDPATAFWAHLQTLRSMSVAATDIAMGQAEPSGRLGGVVRTWQLAAQALLDWHQGVLRGVEEQDFIRHRLAAGTLSNAQAQLLAEIAARANLSWTR